MSKFKITQVLLALCFIEPIAVKAQVDTNSRYYLKMRSSYAIGESTYSIVFFDKKHHSCAILQKNNDTGAIDFRIHGDTANAFSGMWDALNKQAELTATMQNILTRLNLDFIVSAVHDEKQRKELEQFVKEYRSK